MTSQPFDPTSYERLSDSRRSADVVIPLLCELIGRPASVVDFGCGVGAWLAGFSASGVMDCFGLEGGHPEPGQLLISADQILTHDLQEPVDLGRHFDLAISLEVAEHLPASRAASFVGSVARHADVVLFSAAIPRQGGIDHINEQWPSYWHVLWRAQGLECFDVLRWLVWDDREVAAWYRQNLLLYARGPAAERLRAAGHEASVPRSVVHPALLEHYQVALELAQMQQPKRLRRHAREAVWSMRHRRRPRPARPDLDWPL